MICKNCNGNMVGDGYTIPYHCESLDLPQDVESDAPPMYCTFRGTKPTEYREPLKSLDLLIPFEFKEKCIQDWEWIRDFVKSNDGNFNINELKNKLSVYRSDNQQNLLYRGDNYDYPRCWACQIALLLHEVNSGAMSTCQFCPVWDYNSGETCLNTEPYRSMHYKPPVTVEDCEKMIDLIDNNWRYEK